MSSPTKAMLNCFSCKISGSRCQGGVGTSRRHAASGLRSVIGTSKFFVPSHRKQTELESGFLRKFRSWPMYFQSPFTLVTCAHKPSMGFSRHQLRDRTSSFTTACKVRLTLLRMTYFETGTRQIKNLDLLASCHQGDCSELHWNAIICSFSKIWPPSPHSCKPMASVAGGFSTPNFSAMISQYCWSADPRCSL